MYKIVLLLLFSFIVLIGTLLFNETNPSHTPLTKESNNITTDKNDASFTFGIYNNCKIYSRSSMNIPPSKSTLPDKSAVVCSEAGSNKTIIEVTDKPNFETAKNSILQVWYDNEGYKAMVVDQNGAGSGEGNGKVILLEQNGYKLLSCFYYTYETFHKSYNEPYGIYQPLTDQQIKSINENPIELSDPYCANFTVASYIE